MQQVLTERMVSPSSAARLQQNVKKKSTRIGRETRSFFSLYLGIFYLFPALFHLVFTEEYEATYPISNTQWQLLYIPVILLLAVIINTLVPKFSLPRSATYPLALYQHHAQFLTQCIVSLYLC